MLLKNHLRGHCTTTRPATATPEQIAEYRRDMAVWEKKYQKAKHDMDLLHSVWSRKNKDGSYVFAANDTRLNWLSRRVIAREKGSYSMIRHFEYLLEEAGQEWN